MWLQWPHQPATRVPAVAKGWNDRVVVIEWADTTGGLRSVVVWRNAVHQAHDKEAPDPTALVSEGVEPGASCWVTREAPGTPSTDGRRAELWEC